MWNIIYFLTSKKVLYDNGHAKWTGLIVEVHFLLEKEDSDNIVIVSQKISNKTVTIVIEYVNKGTEAWIWILSSVEIEI